MGNGESSYIYNLLKLNMHSKQESKIYIFVAFLGTKLGSSVTMPHITICSVAFMLEYLSVSENEISHFVKLKTNHLSEDVSCSQLS